MPRFEEMSEGPIIWFWLKRALGLGVLVLVGLAAGCPRYNVWSAKMEGEAKVQLQQKEGEAALAHAHSARMVLVTQAEAELQAAQKRADAIKIVGEMAKQYPEYRQQEFIGAFGEALREGKISQVIYVPTEANLPILEAKRH